VGWEKRGILWFALCQEMVLSTVAIKNTQRPKRLLVNVGIVKGKLCCNIEIQEPKYVE